jgi:hypothetical protein
MRLPFAVGVSGILQGLNQSLSDRQHVDLNQRLIRPRVPKPLPLLEAVKPSRRSGVFPRVWTVADAIPCSLLNRHAKGRFDILHLERVSLAERLPDPSKRCRIALRLRSTRSLTAQCGNQREDGPNHRPLRRTRNATSLTSVAGVRRGFSSTSSSGRLTIVLDTPYSSRCATTRIRRAYAAKNQTEGHARLLICTYRD